MPPASVIFALFEIKSFIFTYEPEAVLEMISLCQELLFSLQQKPQNMPKPQGPTR